MSHTVVLPSSLMTEMRPILYHCACGWVILPQLQKGAVFAMILLFTLNKIKFTNEDMSLDVFKHQENPKCSMPLMVK